MTTTKVQLIAILAVFFGIFSFNASAADIQAGKAKSAMCTACHGVDGMSNNPMYPSLAGQRSQYFENQLQAFKSGARDNPTMKGMAASLSNEDIQNLAAYYASLTPKRHGGDKTLAKRGKEKTTMCMGCHGTNAEGRGQFPRLAGQQPAYLAKQLLAFKKGDRKGGPMGAIAGNFSEQDIKEIAAYLGTL